MSLVSTTQAQEPKSTELLLVYKNFGCQMIASAFEVLQSWAQPHAQYSKGQQKQLLETDPKQLDLYNLYIFFIPCEEQPSGLDTIVRRFELELPLAQFEQKTKPLLKFAFMEANRFRSKHGLSLLVQPV
jgi:hypothetical protein